MKKRLSILAAILLVSVAVILNVTDSGDKAKSVGSSNKSEAIYTSNKPIEEKEDKLFTFKEFLGDNNEEVTEIRIMNGDTGFTVKLTDEEEINQLMNFLNDLNFRNIDEEDRGKGWEYRFIVCLGNDEMISILPRGNYKW